MNEFENFKKKKNTIIKKNEMIENCFQKTTDWK